MIQDPPPPPQPPSPPAPAQAPQAISPLTGDPIIFTPGVIDGANPAEVLRAFKEAREELGQQLERLEDRSGDLAREIRETSMAESGIRRVLEQRLSETQQRISTLEMQIALADQQVVRATAVPGAVVPDPPPPRREGPPEEVFIIPVVFIIFVLFPLTIAYVRRLWKRPVAAPMSPEYNERLTRIEQAVDAVAVEVERIGEGQRFMSRLFADPVAARQLEAVATQAAQREAVPAARQ